MIRDLNLRDWIALTLLAAVNLFIGLAGLYGLAGLGAFWRYEAAVFAFLIINPLLINFVFRRAEARKRF